MRGFILSAGFGTRLRPITDHVPKALVPLAAKPLLQHAIDFLQGHGISSIAVNTHYLAGKIALYRLESKGSFEIFHEVPEIRGTGGALDVARTFLAGDGTFIIINADIIARFDLSRQIEAFRQSDDCCRLLAFDNNTGTGTIRFDPDTLRYRGAAGETTVTDGGITADFFGMALYRKEFLTLVGPEDFSILPVWRRALDRGMPVSVGCIHQGYWRDIGSPKSLAYAHFDIIDGLLDLPPPASLVIDRNRKLCHPIGWSGDTGRCGPYSWIGEPLFLPTDTIERTVVFEGANGMDAGKPLQSSLLTPWGALPFDE